MNLNDDEAIGLINRLLEGLHQADLTNFGSHLQMPPPNSVCRLWGAACRDADKYGGKDPPQVRDPPQPSLCREGENHG